MPPCEKIAGCLSRTRRFEGWVDPHYTGYERCGCQEILSVVKTFMSGRTLLQGRKEGLSGFRKNLASSRASLPGTGASPMNRGTSSIPKSRAPTLPQEFGGFSGRSGEPPFFMRGFYFGIFTVKTISLISHSTHFGRTPAPTLPPREMRNVYSPGIDRSNN